MQIAALRKEHAVLVTKQQELEAAYRRVAIDDFGMEEEYAVAKIEQARSAPQKNKRLQAIHEAHVAVLSKESAIKEAESAVALNINSKRKIQTSTPNLNAKRKRQAQTPNAKRQTTNTKRKRQTQTTKCKRQTPNVNAKLHQL